MTLLDDYAAHHRDPRNRLCHEIGIPLIVLALESLLRYLPLAQMNLAQLATLAVMVYYVRLVRRAALPAIAGLLVLYVLGNFVAWPYALALFAAGWILQFVGHAYEGKQPAFLTNLTHLLIGPLWIARPAVGRRSS